MSLLEFPIKRYQFTLVAFAMLVALGLTSFKNIPRQEDPYFPLAIFQVVAIYPGAEPQDVERLVVKPIEDRLSELDDIKKITIRTHEAAIRIIDKKGPLNNPADRDHCIQYMVAVPLIFGRLTAADYEDNVAADPRIDALRERIVCV